MTLPDYPAPGLFIDGVWSDAAKSQPVYEPATGAIIGHVPYATIADLDRAAAAAARVFPVWSGKSPAERAEVLLRARALILERSKDIARILTREQGKALPEAHGEVTRAANILRWDSEEARRAYGRVIPFESGIRLTTLRQPVGPVAAFTPWNFPAGGPLRKLAAGLAAGCTFVLKASEETPGTICAIVKCLDEVGLPKGAVNLVFGDPPMISEHLIAHPAIRMVAFTGSIPVGKHIAGLAARVMKPCLMELGGHAPVIIAEDADPVRAAKGCAAGKFVNAGQVCTSPTRFLVHESLHDQFLTALVAEAKAVKVGNGLDEGVVMGPMANLRRLEAMDRLVADAVQRGAKVETGGHRIGNQGWFFAPTVLSNVPVDCEMMREEPFGPLAPVRPFAKLDDALAEANSLPYGLAAYGFTRAAATAERLSAELQAGILSINHTSGSVQEAPSGGVKESGYGREGGAEALDAYLVTKRISHRLN